MDLPIADNGWNDSTQEHNPELFQKASHILETNLYCTLSTASPDGEPWISPVFFAFDQQWHLYWCSAVASKHSQNIEQNLGKVAVAIFDSTVSEATGKGLYFYGIAQKVKTELLPVVLELTYQRSSKLRKMKTAQDFTVDSVRQLYQFVPEKAWITGERLPVGDHLVDTKIALDLKWCTLQEKLYRN